jgi:hypothetical protein
LDAAAYDTSTTATDNKSDQIFHELLVIWCLDLLGPHWLPVSAQLAMSCIVDNFQAVFFVIPEPHKLQYLFIQPQMGIFAGYLPSFHFEMIKSRKGIFYPVDLRVDNQFRIRLFPGQEQHESLNIDTITRTQQANLRGAMGPKYAI